MQPVSMSVILQVRATTPEAGQCSPQGFMWSTIVYCTAFLLPGTSLYRSSQPVLVAMTECLTGASNCQRIMDSLHRLYRPQPLHTPPPTHTHAQHTHTRTHTHPPTHHRDYIQVYSHSQPTGAHRHSPRVFVITYVVRYKCRLRKE